MDAVRDWKYKHAVKSLKVAESAMKKNDNYRFSCDETAIHGASNM